MVPFQLISSLHVQEAGKYTLRAHLNSFLEPLSLLMHSLHFSKTLECDYPCFQVHHHKFFVIILWQVHSPGLLSTSILSVTTCLTYILCDYLWYTHFPCPSVYVYIHGDYLLHPCVLCSNTSMLIFSTISFYDIPSLCLQTCQHVHYLWPPVETYIFHYVFKIFFKHSPFQIEQFILYSVFSLSPNKISM